MSLSCQNRTQGGGHLWQEEWGHGLNGNVLVDVGGYQDLNILGGGDYYIITKRSKINDRLFMG